MADYPAVQAVEPDFEYMAGVGGGNATEAVMLVTETPKRVGILWPPR